ncbi:MAG TPA: nickel ABC transporter permease [Thermomicrobiales bacterium]|nr:nickel ABC transporter permease [Thermomicrobiales bacterium]
MGAYILQRLIYAVFVLWGALTVIFLVVRILPGDPASMMLGAGATEAEVSELQHNLGLDESMPHQYVTFMSEAVRLDFGESLWLRRPVVESVGERIAATARLALAAVVIALAISFPLGILAALRQRSPIDYAVSVISLIGQSVPSFWLGIMLILIFARQLRWLPSAGSQTPQHLILPAITLALPLVGVLTRLVRSGLLEVMHEDYIRTARAKGLSSRTVLTRHAMRNMLIPVVTVLGIQLGNLLGGAVIVETVFGWPGIGRLLVDAITKRDYPLVQAAILFITTIFVLINLLVDLSYIYLDPRIRLR